MKKKLKPLTDKDGEVRELTAADMKLFRPAREVDPALVAAHRSGTIRYKGQRGKQKAPTKAQVTLRLDRDVLAFFKAKGEGWQTRIGAALRAFVDVAQ
jgi:uncharacterized protein (DUF4415 family)